MKIGDAIRQYRLSQGLTQLQLAIRINKTSRSIKRYESGATVPNLKVLEQIFNKPVQEILSKKLLEV